MQLIIAILNIVLLCRGISCAIKNKLPQIDRPIRVITSFIIALAIISFLYYLMLVCGFAFIWLLAILSLANIAHIYLMQSLKGGISFNAKKLYSIDAGILFSGLSLIIIYLLLKASKHGGWDAWAIWNLHAKFMYNPAYWLNMFSPGLAYSHPDYPLMLPAIIAFFWNSVGVITPLVPMVLSFVVLLLIPSLIYAALSVKKGYNLYAGLGLLLFVVDNNYKAIGALQTADTLLSLLILLVFVLNSRVNHTKSNIIYLIAFICASCTWLKNEGWLFYLIFTAVFTVSNYKDLTSLKKYALGSLIPLLFTLSFKIFFAPVNDLVAANHHHAIQMITDAGRYLTIIKFLTGMLTDQYIILTALLVLAIMINRRYFKSAAFICLLIVFAGYLFIYVTTPYNLNWHLSTSLNRLIQHLYPALVFSVLLSVKNRYPLSVGE